MGNNCSDIAEDALIQRITALMPLEAYPASRPGDDCAAIRLADGSFQLLKTDALIEAVHYFSDTPAAFVGKKAINRVMSDFAAMGGKGSHFLVTLALPLDTPLQWVEELYRGMAQALSDQGATLVGGETTSLPVGNTAKVISIAATGFATAEQLTLRSGARVGDQIWVTGRLGGSLSGKHLHFSPRVKEAQWLTQRSIPTAMMDLSDGLGKDLPRLAKASDCGFVLNELAVPRAEACSLEQAIGDGEDYELLFCAAPEHETTLLAEWDREFPELNLTQIGMMMEPHVVQNISGGWDHFQSGKR